MRDPFNGVLPLKHVWVNCVNGELEDRALSGILALYDISIAALTFPLILQRKQEKSAADIFGSSNLVSLTSASIFALGVSV